LNHHDSDLRGEIDNETVLYCAKEEGTDEVRRESTRMPKKEGSSNKVGGW